RDRPGRRPLRRGRSRRGTPGGARDPVRRARQPEGHHHRPRRITSEGRRLSRPHRDQPSAGPPGAPGPAGQGRQGLAARPQAAGTSGLLSRPRLVPEAVPAPPEPPRRTRLVADLWTAPRTTAELVLR